MGREGGAYLGLELLEFLLLPRPVLLYLLLGFISGLLDPFCPDYAMRG